MSSRSSDTSPSTTAPRGTCSRVPFAFDADVPALWDCKCGAEALLVDAARPSPKATKPSRTHWDMLLERRSIAELEVLLDERLELLRAAPGPPATRQKRSA